MAITFYTVVLLWTSGCTGPSKTIQKADSRVIRLSDHGREAFAEGNVDEAIEKYRGAIHRAWSLDDPYESGMNAYNLAACLTSQSRYAEAKDWLVDARTEFCRAGISTGNAWLLEAKIAQHESRLEDVQYSIDRAACTDPPCTSRLGDKDSVGCCGGACRCSESDPCEPSCVTKIPCVGSKITRNKSIENCKDTYAAQIHLARSRLATEMYDFPLAIGQLRCACQLAEEICGEELQADLQHTAAKIHLAKGEYLQAASHFDKEATHLRVAGNYREIPVALHAAAIAYEQDGRPRLAADRLCRVGRIWFARGETRKAWQYVRSAVSMAEIAGCESTKIRMALLVNEIEKSVAESGEALPVM